MKKYFSFLTIAALGVLALSCAKEMDVNQDNTGKSISKVFTATLEKDDDVTKTEIQSDKSVNWSVGDKILAVWNGGSKASEALTEGGAGNKQFIVNGMGGDAAFAVYPSSIVSTYDGTDFKVTVPPAQDGTFANAAIEVAQVSDSDLAFKNLGGLMKLTITSADVRTVTISSNDGTALAGKATVTFDTAGVPSVASVEEGTSTVTLSFTGEPSTEEPYYVAVLPCELKAGVYIEFKNGEGTVIGEKMTGKTLSVARRQICNFGEVTIVTITDKYFVTVGGNGLKDGSSWENAAGYAALKTHLTQNSVKNKKIYMAAGTYTSTAAVTISNTSFSIFGGYPADAEGTSLAGRNITANETVFDGNDTYSIYTFSSIDIDGSFDGVTFTKGARNDNKAGCALVIAKVKKLSCANCKFTSNVTTSGSGGVMRADAGTLVFSKCTFSNNSAKAGGVVYAGYTNSSSPSITFNECSFNNNSSTEGAGGVLHVAEKSGCSPTIAFTKCSFSGNSSSRNGGVINTGVETGPTTITVTGCQFNNNTSSAYASVIYLDGYATVNIDGSYFGGNNADSRGAIRLSTANSIVRINNSSFRDNTSSNICTDILVTNGILAVNNCSFSHSASRNIPAIQNSAEALIVNSSLQGGVNTEKGIIYNGSANASLTLANNIILNTNDGAKPAVTNPNSGTVTSCGYNAYYYSLPSTEEGDFLTDKGYRLGWNDTDKILWKSNNMFPYGPNKTAENPDPMPKGTPAKVLEAIQKFDTANPTAGVETWLNGAYLKDALGTTRNTEGCWPGAYEGK